MVSCFINLKNDELTGICFEKWIFLILYILFNKESYLNYFVYYSHIFFLHILFCFCWFTDSSNDDQEQHDFEQDVIGSQEGQNILFDEHQEQKNN